MHCVGRPRRISQISGDVAQFIRWPTPIQWAPSPYETSLAEGVGNAESQKKPVRPFTQLRFFVYSVLCVAGLGVPSPEPEALPTHA